MNNTPKSRKQRERWNTYNKKYARENYKSFSVRLNKKSDKEMLTYIEGSGKSVTAIFKELLNEKLKNNK